MNESLPIKQRWRAEQGKEFAYITINSYGKVRITKAYEHGNSAEDSLWENGDYFRIAEAQNFADMLTIFLKNRI